MRLIARSAHLQALTERGLRVRTVKGDFQVQVPATDDPAQADPRDFVFIRSESAIYQHTSPQDRSH